MNSAETSATFIALSPNQFTSKQLAIASMFDRLHSLIKEPVTGNVLRTNGILGVRLVAQAGTLLLLSRLLGPSQFGFFAGLASLSLLLGTLSTFGLHLTLLRDLSRNPSQRDLVLPQTLGSTAFVALLLFFAYLVICGSIFALSGEQFILVILIGAAEIIIQPFLLISASERQAYEKVAQGQFYIVLPLIMRLFLVLILCILHLSDPLTFYVWGYIATILIALALSVKKIRGKWPPPSRWKILGWEELNENMSYALTSLTNRGSAELDKVLGTQLLSPINAGHYAASSRAIGALITPVSALVMTVMPRLFRQSEKRDAIRMYRWIFFISFFYGIIAGFFLYTLSPLIAKLFGAQYPNIDVYLKYLSLALPARGLSLSGCSILMSMNRPSFRVAGELSGVLIFIVGAFALTPSHPILGFPISYAISEYSAGAISWVLVIKQVARPSKGA